MADRALVESLLQLEYQAEIVREMNIAVKAQKSNKHKGDKRGAKLRRIEKLVDEPAHSRKRTEALKPTGVVGSGAPRIQADNVGSLLLRGMGWNGGALGASQSGATEPIAVLIKYDKRGLGFD
jgi:hypothetical protein